MVSTEIFTIHVPILANIFNLFTKSFNVLISGALAWNADMLSSGSRDRLILQRDIRTPSIVPERRLTGHKQEVGILNYIP